ncbi:prefoldin subunit beta [Candidatus Pacearchaeota archaeon]|nr:prefoldin subunit beta [Candidatus Pacearchaeota archaeon]
MDVNSTTAKKIQELQVLEQNLQSLFAQKQSVQVELNEVKNALDELKKSGEEVYKIISGLMIKSSRESLIKEMEEKNKLFELRISSIEKQENIIDKRASEFRQEITSSLDKSNKKE